MKPFVRGCVAVALCLAVVGCGGTPTRVWRGPRLRSGGYAADPAYAPPVEPSYESLPPEPMREPMPEIAPPAPPGNLAPPPRSALRLQEEVPAPPPEDEESVQFLAPVPPSAMPNALYPEESKPILEQSAAEKPTHRQPREVLGEGKIALSMRGHSTFVASNSSRTSVRLESIEPEREPSPKMMQVQYLPLLAPVPNL